MSVAAVRNRAIDLLVAATTPVVEAVWASELPADAWPTAHRAIAAGVQEAVRDLTLNPAGSAADERWGTVARIRYGVAHYWEPPVAGVPVPDMPPSALRARRWAASLIAGYVRNHLETLHARYTGDDAMPALNRGLRNACFDVLLSNPLLAERLTVYPTMLIELNAIRGYPAIPAVAG